MIDSAGSNLLHRLQSHQTLMKVYRIDETLVRRSTEDDFYQRGPASANVYSSTTSLFAKLNDSTVLPQKQSHRDVDGVSNYPTTNNQSS